MTTEIKFNPSLSAAVAAQGAGANEQPSILQEKQVAPLLGGENVRVLSGAMTDLEKLVARLKSEDDATRTSVAQMRLTAVITALDTAGEPFRMEPGYLEKFDRLMDVTDLFRRAEGREGGVRGGAVGALRGVRNRP